MRARKNVTNRNTEKVAIAILTVMLFAYLIKDISSFKGIVIINDEFGYWGIAAYLAGKDWSGLLSSVPYYAYGYSILLVPLFWLDLSPALMYQIALVMNAFMLCASFMISIKCIKKIIPEVSPLVLYGVCFVTCLYTNNVIQAQVAWTETLLYLLTWCLLYSFISIVEKPKLWNIVLGTIVAIYMYAVHQRTIGILLVFFGMVFVRLCMKSGQRRWILVSLGLALLLLFIHKGIKEDMIRELFTNPELVALNDYSGQTSKIKAILFTIDGMRRLLQSMAGKLFYIGISTFLIGFVGLWTLFKSLWSFAYCFIKSHFKSWKTSNYIYAYILLSFAAIYMISAISMYNNSGRLDLLIYGRYMEMAIGPVIAVGLIEILERKVEEKEIVVGIGLLLLLSFAVDQGLISSNTDFINGFCVATLYYFFRDITEVPGMIYILTIALCIPICSVYIIKSFCERRKKMKQWSVVSMMIVGAFWIYLADYSPAKDLQVYTNKNVGEEISQLEQNRTVQQIYYVLDEEEFQNSDISSDIKYIQYYLPDTRIQIVKSKDFLPIAEDGVVYVVNAGSKIEDDFEKTYSMILCGKNLTFFSI